MTEPKLDITDRSELTSVLADIPNKVCVRDPRTLIATFPGAVNRSKAALPYFEWARSLEQRTESYICLSDPTLNINEKLTLGWFIGDANIDVQKAAAQLIMDTAARIGAEKIITVGSSGGGYAALAVSAYIPGSTAIAFSPSTAIDRVTPAHTQNLLDAAFPDMDSFDDLFSLFPERVSLESLYSVNKPNRFYLVQNSGDTSRITRSFEPFAASLGLPLKGGSTRDGRWNLVMEDHGEGHIPPPKDRFQHWLDVACSA